MVAVQYRLRPEVDLFAAGPGVTLLARSAEKAVTLGTASLAAMARALQAGWMTEEEAVSGLDEPSRGYHALFVMGRAWLLEARLTQGGAVLFSVSPSLPDIVWKAPGGPAGRYVLNRYAFVRRVDGAALLESPLTPCRVAVRQPGLARLLADLCAQALPDVVEGEAAILLGVLASLGCAEKAGEDGGACDPMRYWEFHDLLFHVRSLRGKSAHPHGMTYRFKGVVPSLPVVRPPVGGEVVDLAEPTAEMAGRLASPLSEVLAARASRREFAAGPVSLDVLAAFLFAVARVREIRHVPEHDEALSRRPSPSGGARHALETYLLVRSCRELPPGFYHYDPLGHRLERLPVDPADLASLSADNPHDYQSPEPPQVTLYFSARIGRAAWKYEAIAYKVVNQDLGCLYQTCYLAATALGLAPCAIGTLDSALLGRVSGIDWREEPFVGVFTLGVPVAP
ncbi:SagB family peptide dehydrogenase [Solidesulfovibrio sp.]|uniref:SagB family peptide dehydrogenase n=1 Tax=Solidesulfovibrio sp. TaxID=2910990 RepID=UPI0026225F50|nr:SagB family peptide dehydrogenase [Solidesulfovibrio sp.]